MTETGTHHTSADNNNNQARNMLLKANKAHGGHKLDKIKTMRFSANIMGAKAVSHIDIPDHKIRIELWENDQITSIEQLENGQGWQWYNNKQTAMPAERVAEMESTFYSGLLGLRKPALNEMEVVHMHKLQNNTYSLLCKLDGNDYVFAIDAQNHLTAEANKTHGRTSVSVLSDLRTVEGIVIPFQETVTSGIKKLTIQYDEFEINPSFDQDKWLVPESN